MAAAHRVWQFFSAVTARVTPAEERLVENHLNPEQRALFQAMAVNDQRHALNVLYRLQAAGQDHPHLLQAALLHDAGKSAGRVHIATRVAVVLLILIDRRLVHRLARADGGCWQRQLYAHAYHELVGADMAARAGSPEEVVRLIARHGGKPEDDLGRALFEADEES